MEDFVYKYFMEPVLMHSGYNLVNTIVYALIALGAVYLIFRGLEQRKIRIENEFILGTIAFVLLGSTVRVVTDSIDNGIFENISPVHKIILESHIYDYGFITASPGIYIVIATLFLISLAVVSKLKKMELLKCIGIGLWFPHFLLLLPFMKHVVYAIPILLLTIIPALIALFYFKGWKYGALVGSHGLDGGATFFMIDFFGKVTGTEYWEQHVLSRTIGELFNTYFTFYAIKIILAFTAAHFIAKEKSEENERNYIILLIIIIGLAPGIRDVLRMCIGG